MNVYNKMDKKLTKSEIGKKSRKSGMLFELRVRHDLEDQGYIITKWQNQIDFEKQKIIPAPSKFNFFTKSIIHGSGFPDYLAISREPDGVKVIGVESKSSKYLDKEEKKKCEWYLEHKIFDMILIAYKDKKGHIQFYKYEKGEGNDKGKEIC